MAVRVKIPTILRRHTAGVPVVEATGATIGEILADIESRHPGVTGPVRSDDGALRRFVNIYVNEEDVRHHGSLSAPVADGDVVTIIPAVAGG